ncbi:MAG: hypothetical protein H6506_03950 [Calditrichaeota bacterium]|nr:hypothetical protein [Calditrichota bacterium]MCB9367224.1 hypothetical protein [Calditrichota bacterium]MCB9391787.1 hypothetical protein [Calditrichota bacterium]
MKIINTVVLTCLVLAPGWVLADTTWVASGNVSGVWSASGSPFVVYTGDVTVAATDTLMIEPGVRVYFAGAFKMIVNGLLQAIGTQSDSIWFTGSSVDFPFPSPERWRGLRFENANAANQLTYCSITYGGATGAGIEGSGGGVYCVNSTLSLSHSWIHHCHAYHNCAAVFDQSTVLLDYTDITYNYGVVDPEYFILNGEVGAFATGNTTIHLRHCNISHNNPGGSFSAIRFGVGTTAVMDSCLIDSNLNPEGGFGPVILDATADVSMTGTTISNHQPMYGFDGGIRSDGASLTMEACTLRSNRASWVGPTEWGGSSALTIFNPVSAVITNTVFEGNQGQFGAASLCQNTTFENCIFRNNTSSDGAIFSNGGNRFSRCVFENNTANLPDGLLAFYGNGRGGAMVFFSGTDTVSQCVFTGNTSYIYTIEGEPETWDTLSTFGAALYCDEGASPYLVNCVFQDNTLNQGSFWGTGSVLYSYLGHPTFEFCTMNNNGANGHPGGVMFLDGGTLTLRNSIVSNSDARCAIYFDLDATGTVEYCDFYGITNMNFRGTPPVGLGTLSTTNANGDPCDVYYNILLNPEYADAMNGDLHLTSGSPCIGAADPASTVASDYDGNARPSGTYADMGAFEFSQTAVIELVIYPDAENDDILLYWNAVPGASSYEVYAGDVPEYDPPFFNLIGTTSLTTFTEVDALLSSDQRTYVVVAVP